jgi:hypothetical protein
MSKNRSALVPLETWAYSAPELISRGRTIDIGLFAESLIYYDTVIINPTNQPQLAEFINWFIQQGALNEFYALMETGVINVCEHSFLSTAILREGEYSLWNVQDQIQAKDNSFTRRFLYHKSIEDLFPKSRHRKRLYGAFCENVIELKSDSFCPAIENAREDFKNPRRNTIVIQAFIDELYRVKNLGRPPEVKCSVTNSPDGTKHQLHYNIDFNELNNLCGEKINFDNSTPLTASAHCNKFIWSASLLECDLFLPRPMSVLVGDKLYESKEKIAKSGGVIEELKEKVEFPDIRHLVNSGQINFADVIKIRNKSQKFRSWLQQENGRDRDAIIAYHNEVAKELGLLKGARKALQLFGIIGGGATGSAIGATMAGPSGGAIGGAVGSSLGYLADVSSKVGSEWKPVIFGDWMRDRIEKAIKGDEQA